MRYTGSMIRRLQGKIIDLQTGMAILDVRGVGYAVNVPTYWSPSNPQDVVLWTHQAVRETSLELYGFSHQFECDLFEQLLTIPKIGPKSALQIINKASIDLLLQCAKANDASQLVKRSGLGKKTAEKVVAGLHDSPLVNQVETQPQTTTNQDDSIATLIALGYSEREAHTVITTICKENPDIQLEPKQLITQALRALSSQS